MLKLTDELITKFHPIGFQVNTNNEKRILSIKFSQNGNRLLGTTNLRSLEIFNCDQGIQLAPISMRKHGCNAFDYTTSNDTIVVSSTVGDNIIRSLNIENKAYVSLYDGHSSFVTSVKTHNEMNMMMSTCEKGQLFMWDLRSQQCIGAESFGGTPVIDWYPSGSMFAVGRNSEIIELYDIRGLSHGPFTKFRFNRDAANHWINLQFSENGKFILIDTNGAKIKVADSIFGNVINSFGKSRLKYLLQQNYINYFIYFFQIAEMCLNFL